MNQTNSKLDFLVIGSQKCATTWLYECLNDHPEICLPKHKREIEYVGGELYKEKGMEWYLSLLDHCTGEKVKGDVSVEYIVNTESPALLHKLNPGLRFILSMRNPTERALSALKWYTRKGVITDDQTHLVSNLKEAIQTFSLDAASQNKLHDVLYRGLYKQQLKSYLQYFDQSQILIVRYEDVKKNPADVLKKIYGFLNVSETFVPASLQTQPKKNSNNKTLVQLERRFSKNKIMSFVVDKLHQVLPKNEDSFFKSEKEIRDLFNHFYQAHAALVEPSLVKG